MELRPEGVVSDAGGVRSHSDGNSVVLTKGPIYLRRALENRTWLPSCEFKGRRVAGLRRNENQGRVLELMRSRECPMRLRGGRWQGVGADDGDGDGEQLPMSKRDRATKEIRQGRGRRKDHRSKRKRDDTASSDYRFNGQARGKGTHE
jgi:hypothetical protein